MPALLLYVIFILYPFARSIYTSFFEWNGISRDKKFVGFDNYLRLFRDPIIWEAFKNNVFIMFWCTIFTFAISIFFAVILTRKTYKLTPFYKIVFFLPHVLSLSVVSIVWMFIYNPSFGLLNSFLSSLKLDNLIRLWLGDKSVIMGALTVPLVWINVGFYMVIFISGILDIPIDLFEAAEIDGANERQQFFYITLKEIWEIIRIALVFFVVTAFCYSFELIYIMTKGGPNRASELLTTYLYENAFKTYDFGYASTIGSVLFIIVFAVVFTLLKITKRDDV